jgi:tetratricopeptide (TPR) repeat protein
VSVKSGQVQPTLNTTQVLNELDNNIVTVKPDLIILLIGGANKWNYIGYSEYLREKSLFSLSQDYLYRIRVYKLAKLLFLNIRKKVKNNLENLHFIIKRFIYKVQNKYEEALKWFKEGIRVNPRDSSGYAGIGWLYKDQGNYEEALKWFKEGIRVNPRDSGIYHEIGQIYEKQDNYEEAIKWFMKGIKSNPNRRQGYIGLMKILEKTDRKYYAEIKDSLRRITRGNQVALNFIEMLKNKNIEQELIDWVRHDIERIIILCQSRGIKIILQNYPCEEDVNKVIKEFAIEHSIPFVNNLQVFNELLSNKEVKREDYFRPDGHCTSRGYGIIAQNLYDKIMEEKIFSLKEK